MFLFSLMASRLDFKRDFQRTFLCGIYLFKETDIRKAAITRRGIIVSW